MRNKIILSVALFLCFNNVLLSQVSLKATISNYPNQTISYYQCYTDSLIFIDSIKTDPKGKFIVSAFKKTALYKFVMPNNQGFYILNDGKETEIKTVYLPNISNNWASDSLEVVKSDENKMFYAFQQQQKLVTIANYVLKEIMRLYPLQDPFHKQIEAEYVQRYKAMEQLFEKVNRKHPNSFSAKFINAYYQPLNPNWKQPDQWRDSIIVAHYFDYFNPTDSFYLNTNILPEKIEIYLGLKTNKKDDYGQPINDEMLFAKAAQEFVEQTKVYKTAEGRVLKIEDNVGGCFDFCLQYLLKKFNKEHKETAFLYLCDQNLKAKEGNCQTENKHFDWAREKAGKLRNIAIGSPAPDFNTSDNMQLSGIQSDYTLVLFWATWCPHCTQEVPKIKKTVDDFNQKSSKKIITVAVSLDSDKELWQKFLKENNLASFINFSEFKGWQSEVVKKYSVYATPTMFLLDKDKKIIAKPLTVEELTKNLTTNSK